jgi:hypothetical protein
MDNDDLDRPTVATGGPALPAPYTPDNDVNPICGCHLRSRCDGCGTCTSCDGCYCGEDY